MFALTAEQAPVMRGSIDWAMLPIDVDHFKRVNDTHGHAVGGQVLVRVANVLRPSSREVDIVARRGGEVFCVLAPMTPPHDATLLVERLCQAVEAGASDGQVSVAISVGVSLAQARGEDSADAAVARADVALCRAKAAGRNRVELPGEAELAASAVPVQVLRPMA